MYGPLVLAARSDEEPKDMWYRQFTAQEKMEPAAMLRFVGNTEDPYSWLEPAAGSLNFRTVAQGQPVTFVPLSRIVHERYSVYVEVSGRSS